MHLTNFMLLVPCLFLPSIYQPTKALNITQIVANTKFLHVVAQGCYLQVVFYNRGVKTRHTSSALNPLRAMQCLDQYPFALGDSLSEVGTPMPKHVGVWCLP